MNPGTVTCWLCELEWVTESSKTLIPLLWRAMNRTCIQWWRDLKASLGWVSDTELAANKRRLLLSAHIGQQWSYHMAGMQKNFCSWPYKTHHVPKQGVAWSFQTKTTESTSSNTRTQHSVMSSGTDFDWSNIWACLFQPGSHMNVSCTVFTDCCLSGHSHWSPLSGTTWNKLIALLVRSACIKPCGFYNPLVQFKKIHFWFWKQYEDIFSLHTHTQEHYWKGLFLPIPVPCPPKGTWLWVWHLSLSPIFKITICSLKSCKCLKVCITNVRVCSVICFSSI